MLGFKRLFIAMRLLTHGNITDVCALLRDA